jgi:hypothetical protein
MAERALGVGCTEGEHIVLGERRMWQIQHKSTATPAGSGPALLCRLHLELDLHGSGLAFLQGCSIVIRYIVICGNSPDTKSSSVLVPQYLLAH